MEYSWNCKNVEVYPTVEINGTVYADVVHSINWELTATENGDSQVYIGYVNLDITNLTNFTDYSQLNNATVAQWVEDSIGAAGVEEIKATLAKCITDRQIVKSESEKRTLPE